MTDSVHALAGLFTSYGHALSRWLLAVNAWTAALLAGALLLDAALARRARASWRIALYAPVFLRAVVPLSWTVSLAHAPRMVTLLTPRPDGFLPPVFTPAEAPLFTWQSAAVFGYLAVALAMAGIRLRAWLRLRRDLSAAVPVVLPVRDLPCAVFEHPHLGPMVVGALRPRIVLPAELLASDRAQELACVLGHETAHVRRGDARLAALLQIATVAFWPVLPLWLAARRVRALVEMACDEAALDDADAAARARYGRTLLAMAEWRTVTVSPLGAGELHFGSMLAVRIRAIVAVRRWPRVVQASLVAAAVAGFAACSSVGSSTPTNGPAGTGTDSVAQRQGWVAPARELHSEQDLIEYCGPLLEVRVNEWGRPMPPRYRQTPAHGVPAEQVAFCHGPAIEDLVAARRWAGEARDALGQMGKDIAAEYEGHGVSSGRYELCPSAPPVPRVAQRAGEKYQTTCDKDWTDHAGWSCLQFCMDAPFYFQYELVSDGQHVQAKAHGQRKNYLGQTVEVSLSLRGDVLPENHALDIAPNIEETWKTIP